MRIGILSVLILLGSFHFAEAQSFGAEPLTVKISPSFPGPYQTVTVTPESTLVNLSASTVTISVNGKVINEGSGGESASFVAGGPGETATVKVSVSGPDGAFEKSVTVTPSSVALILEPSSTTHPFYKGASLIATQGRIRLIALPELSVGGKLASPSSLVYTWKLGDQLLQAQSGIGRSTLTATAPLPYRDADISVTVSTQDGSVSGRAVADLTPTDPLVLIYRNSPLAGPEFDHAITDDYTLDGDEESFRAVPYYFSQDPSVSWSVDGTVSSSEPIVTVRTTSDAAGSAALSVNAAIGDSYEAAAASIGVNFGVNANSFLDFFGL